MKYVVYETGSGLVVSASETPGDIEEILTPPGTSSLEIPEEADLAEWGVNRAVVGGQIVVIPARPSGRHQWVNGAWADPTPIGQLKEEKSKLIDIERERRNQLPIEYDEAVFDADAKAQRNISAWMTNIALGVMPPTGFVWRDYDNVNHPADAAFVTGLGAVVTLRGTLLYQTAWQKKAALNALTTVEAVNAFDPLSGW